MSNTIDQRIVEMKFDNKQFESNVSTSMSTINKLKQNLDMSGASRGLENVNDAVKGIDMSGLSNAIGAVSSSFSALQIMGVTALANITNSAINAGKAIVSALTIEPIMTGFSEYETKINSVQTILANTSSKQEKVNKEAITSINNTAELSVIAAKEANEKALDNLKSNNQKRIKEQTRTAQEEIEVLNEKYENESEALKKAIDEESKSLKNAHQEKLELYHEEYMEKLKVIDEERYNKIKAIDDEINSINNLTKAEDEELKRIKQRKKLAELEESIRNAKTYDELRKAEEKLAEYKTELAREQILKERKDKIKQLEDDKDSINEEYKLLKEQIKQEYEEKKDSENKIYELKSENLKEEHDEKRKALKKTFDSEKKLLKEKHAVEMDALTAYQSTSIKSMNERHKLALDNIETEKKEQLKALTSVQTAATKGSTLEDVNKALDELNLYADKTIYNFTEMTRNIGTFTAAGVDLDTSVSAIKGIANLAAVSGSTSHQASTAMYQLSQALASGTVKLMDWNSVVNAGMGGKVFQDSLTETARVHGIAIDMMIAEEGSFRETLKHGWLTSDILTETLSKFTGDLNEEQLKTMGYSEEQIKSIIEMGKVANDAATKVKTFTQLFDTLKEAAQSGWTNSWEIIVGDFEEAKELLTEVSDVFGKIIDDSANARNELLQGWKDLGGRTSAIEAVRNAFEGIASIIKPVKEAFHEIFPPLTAQRLFSFTEGLKKLTEKLKLSETTSNNLKRTFKGLFAVLDIMKQVFSAIFNAVHPLFGEIGNLSGGILEITACFGDWLVKLNETIKTTDIFNGVIQRIIDFIKTAVESIKTFVKTVSEKINFPGFEVFHALLERIHKRMSQIGEAAGSMKSGVVVAVKAIGTALANSKFFQLMEAIWNLVKSVAGGIVKALGNITSGLVDNLSNANFDGVIDIINALSMGGIAIAAQKFFKSLSKPLEGFKGIMDGVTGVLDGVRGCLEAYQTQLKAGTLLKIAAAIAILAGSILVISLIDSDKLAASLGAITILFADLMTSMAVFNKISGTTKGAMKSIVTLIGISFAVLILASALKKIADLDIEQLVVGLTGVAGLTAIIVGAAITMGNSGTAAIKGAVQMVIFAAAIKILASVCEDLAQLTWEQLVKGLTGVGILMAEISIFLNTAKFSGKSITTATGIVILAAAIKILASACEDFGQMDWEQIAKGLTSIGVLLLEVVAFTKLTGNAKHVISSGIALIAIAAAMKIFASAIQDFANMQWDELIRGLVGMAGALTAVTIALNFMPKNMVGIGVGLIAVSAALLIMAGALGKMGDMTWDEIAKGLVALGGSMAILAIGLNVMNGTLAGSAALLVAVGALAILAPVLSILGAMSWEAIAKGLVAIAGAFAIIGVAGLVLGPIVPAILGLAGAFALIGVGVLALGAGLLAAGAGLSALAVGFTALAAAGAAGATAFVAALTVIILGIIDLIPAILEKIGEGILAFCKVISDGAPAIGEAIKAIFLTLIDVLIESVPAIAEGALQLIVEVLDALVTYTPQIVDNILKFIIELLKGVARNLPELIEAAIEVIMAFFEGVVNALSNIDVDVLTKGIVGIGILSGIMMALSLVAGLIPGAMIGVLGMGVVIAELALVLAAIGALAQIPGLKWLIDEGAQLMEGVGNAIGSFIGGIVGGFMNGISSRFPQIGTDLSNFMKNVQPFVDGARQIDASVMDGVKALASVILALTAANILDGLSSWFTGGSSIVKFGEELAEFGPSLKKYAESIEGIDSEVVANSVNAAKALAGMAKNLPNSGGVVGWFMGENSLSAFAEELVKFGPSLKKYAESVDGLDSDVVINSTTAAKALAEMAKHLPNSGGVLGWFMGENNLSDFAKELVKFGPSLKKYADSVKGLDSDVVINSTNAAKALSELAKNLPNSGGVVGWFMGENDIGTFGKSLKNFGKHFKDYYDQIKEIKVDKLNMAVKAIKNLVTMAKDIHGIDGKELEKFGKSLKKLGKTGVDEFIKAFTEASKDIKKAASEMLTIFINAANEKKETLETTFVKLIQDVIDAINNKKSEFKDSAQLLLTSFTDGINDNKKVLLSKITAIVQDMVDTFNEKKIDFKDSAKMLLTSFTTGINEKESVISDMFVNLVKNALENVKKLNKNFKDVGTALVDGFVDGMNSNIEKVEKKSKEMASAAVKAAEDELEIKSPSRVFYRVGNFAGLAFVNALKSYVDKSYDAGYDMAESANNGLSKAITKISNLVTNNIDTEPTIRPVMDLSNIQNGANQLFRMMNKVDGYSVSGSVGIANHTANMMNRSLSNRHNANDSKFDSLNKVVSGMINNPVKKFENVFNITGDNPKQIAEEVSRIIQRQVERKDASWA